MEEVDDLYDDLLAFDDDLLSLETPKLGGKHQPQSRGAVSTLGDGKKRKMGDMLAGGGVDLEIERPLKKPMGASVPPGLDPRVKRENSAKMRADVAGPLSQPRSIPATTGNPVMSTETIVMADYVAKPPKYVRYFILKSNNLPNLRRSVENAVWATQPHNEGKLNEAYHMTDEVKLIFSVNQSGHFQGYARMSSPIGRGPKHGFWVGSSWGGLFQVEWELLYNLPFHKVEHLGNPLNEGKPVKIAKDGQEVPAGVAMEVIRLMREGAKLEGVQKPEPQHKLYVDPAPYFGPIRESRQRQAHMHSNPARARLPDVMMGPLPGIDHGPNHDLWMGRYHDGTHQTLRGFGRGSTSADRRSSGAGTGISRDTLEKDAPPRSVGAKCEPDQRQSLRGQGQLCQSPGRLEVLTEPLSHQDTLGEDFGAGEKVNHETKNEQCETKIIEDESQVAPSRSPNDSASKDHPMVKEEPKTIEDVAKENETLVQKATEEPKRSGVPSPNSGAPLQSLGPPKTNMRNRKHLFELTYDEYLEQYYKFQDQLREMISSGALWHMLGMGVPNGNAGAGPLVDGDGAGNKPFDSSSGAGSGDYGSRIRFSDKAVSNGSVNKPMLESEYVEFCRRFCQAHSFAFDESKVRKYYHGMKVQYEAMNVKGSKSSL